MSSSRVLVSLVVGAGLSLMASAVASAAPITSVSFNTSTNHSYNGGWGGGATGWTTAANMARSHALTADSLDGNGAAIFSVNASTDPATYYWRNWFGLGWFGVNNANAVADPSLVEISFDAKAANIGNALPGATNTLLKFFHSGADVGWAQTNVQSATKVITLSSDWQHFSFPLSQWNSAFDLSSAGGRNYLVMELQMSADSGSGFAGFNASGLSSVSFDNLQLTVVPEPAALGLLSLAGLLLCRRRTT